MKLSISHHRLLLLLLSSCLAHSLTAASIRGEMAIDSTWWPEIYLSAIHSFEELTTTSDDFIINSTTIHPDGSFEFEALNLPEEDRIYRLHIRKKGDPVSTIIIGGQEQNHVHFILNKTQSIALRYDSIHWLFNGLQVKGYWPNDGLSHIAQLKQAHKTRASRGSRERQYVRSEFQQDLKAFADSSQHLLTGLFAIHELDIDHNFSQYQTWITHWIQRHSNDGSIYLNHLKRQVEFLSFKEKEETKASSPLSYLIVLMILVVLCLMVLWRYRKYQTPKLKGPDLSLLSPRERRVFQLLLEGKTNKEIAAALHIEINTVKSHINSIYSKLEIKSRKDIIKFQSAKQ